MNTNTRKYLYAHTSQETAYLVNDYPWGFRLRTQIRYWVESKKGKGQRFASQTINPKTGKWCAPKYTTYAPIVVMFLDEKNHVQYLTLRHYSAETDINEFKETHLNYLSDFQKSQLKEIIAFNEVMKHVTFKVEPYTTGPVSLFSQDPEEIAKRERLAKEQEERNKQRELDERRILAAINYEKGKVQL